MQGAAFPNELFVESTVNTVHRRRCGCRGHSGDEGIQASGNCCRVPGCVASAAHDATLVKERCGAKGPPMVHPCAALVLVVYNSVRCTRSHRRDILGALHTLCMQPRQLFHTVQKLLRRCLAAPRTVFFSCGEQCWVLQPLQHHFICVRCLLSGGGCGTSLRLYKVVLVVPRVYKTRVLFNAHAPCRTGISLRCSAVKTAWCAPAVQLHTQLHCNAPNQTWRRCSCVVFTCACTHIYSDTALACCPCSCGTTGAGTVLDQFSCSEVSSAALLHQLGDVEPFHSVPHLRAHGG